MGKKVNWKINDNEETLVILVENGYSNKEIAKFFKCSVQGVATKISELGLSRNRISWCNSNINKLIKLSNQPWLTYEDIAKDFDCSVDNIKRVMYENKIKKVTYEDVGKRVCRHCGHLKPLDNNHFTKLKINKYGYNTLCKDCYKSYKLKYKK